MSSRLMRLSRHARRQPRCPRRGTPSAPRRTPSRPPAVPSISLRPKSIAIIRSTTRSRAWTMCSIHTTATPRLADVADRRDQREHLGFGQAARDLVEEQQPRLGRQRACQFEALAFEQRQRARRGVGAAQHAEPVERLDGGRLDDARGRRPPRPPRSERRADEHVLEDGETLERTRDLRRCVRCPCGNGRGPHDAVTSTPSSVTVPESARRSPAIRLSSVVLPAPFGPTMPTASPSATSNDRRSTTVRPPNRLDSRSTESSAVTAAAGQASSGTIVPPTGISVACVLLTTSSSNGNGAPASCCCH